MENENLYESLNKLGLPLFETKRRFDISKTLSEVVKSRDIRLWEGFPVLLANANKEGEFAYKGVLNLLKKEKDSNSFLFLFLMSLACYKYLHLKFGWANKLYNQLPSKDKKKVMNFVRHFKEKGNFIISQKQLDALRIEKMFKNYYVQKVEVSDSTSIRDKLSLEYALSQAFPPKQKELFLKKLKGEKLTRTEIEYFSRIVKKKALVLAHPELHKLAQRLLKSER